MRGSGIEPSADDAETVMAGLNQTDGTGARIVGHVVDRPDAGGPAVLGLPGLDAP